MEDGKRTFLSEYFDQFNYALLRWPALATLGRSKFIKSFNWFFLLVPMASVALKDLPDVISVQIFGAVIPIGTELPFRLQIFYSCAVCFFIANTIFTVFCPYIIRQFPSNLDFNQSGAGFEVIRHLIASGTIGGTEAQRRKLASLIVTAYCDQEQREIFPLKDSDLEIGLAKATVSADKLPNVYSKVFNYAASARPVWRAVCFSGYAIAFLFLAIVLIQNIAFVFSMGKEL